jgi:hypothetical protein
MIETGWATDAFLRHYASVLGESTDSHLFGSEKLRAPIHICRYDGAVPGAILLLTAGLSEYAHEIGCATEVAFVTKTHADELADFLFAALRFAILQKLPIAPGFSLQGLSAINPTLAAECGKEALYFTELTSLPTDLGKMEAASPELLMLSALLISKAENDYFLEQGAEALDSKLKDIGAAYKSIDRPSVV